MSDENNPVPNKIAFELDYSDDSGVEYGVSYNRNAQNCDGLEGTITLESVDKINLPVGKLDWLINTLTQIKKIHESEVAQ